MKKYIVIVLLSLIFVFLFLYRDHLKFNKQNIIQYSMKKGLNSMQDKLANIPSVDQILLNNFNSEFAEFKKLFDSNKVPNIDLKSLFLLYSSIISDEVISNDEFFDLYNFIKNFNQSHPLNLNETL